MCRVPATELLQRLVAGKRLLGISVTPLSVEVAAVGPPYVSGALIRWVAKHRHVVVADEAGGTSGRRLAAGLCRNHGRLLHCKKPQTGDPNTQLLGWPAPPSAYPASRSRMGVVPPHSTGRGASFLPRSSRWPCSSPRSVGITDCLPQ